jgi:hypothetical protein
MSSATLFEWLDLQMFNFPSSEDGRPRRSTAVGSTSRMKNQVVLSVDSPALPQNLASDNPPYRAVCIPFPVGEDATCAMRHDSVEVSRMSERHCIEENGSLNLTIL